MSTTLDHPRAATLSMPEAAITGVPWYLGAVTLASTSVIVGLLWDISWHRTIGRDAVPHAGARRDLSRRCVRRVLVRSSGAQDRLRGHSSERAVAVSFWGFKAPLGAWVCIWGSFAMLTSLRSTTGGTTPTGSTSRS
jgi:hypothetical protein